MPSLRRPAALLLAAALVLSAHSVLAGSNDLPPERQTGSVGPYAITDGQLMTAAICRFADAEPLKLQRIIVKPPKVRWPDTDSEKDGQHGRVRHRILIQRSDDEGKTWRLHAASAPQTAVASETTAAPLTKRAVPIAIGNKFAMLRIVSKIEWLRADGSVRGSLKHWYAYTRPVSDQLQGSIEPGPCANVILH